MVCLGAILQQNFSAVGLDTADFQPTQRQELRRRSIYQPECEDISDESDHETLARRSAAQIYRENLELVQDIMGLARLEDKIKATFTMGLTKKDMKQKLPVAEDYANMFGELQAEWKAESGSKRAVKKLGIPYDVGAVPQRSQPRMSNYEIEGMTWKATAVPSEIFLLGSSLYKGKDKPLLRLDDKRMSDLESSNREVLNIASYLQWFTKAMDSRLNDIMGKLQNEPVSFEEWQDIWNDARETQELLGSVVKGHHDIVKNSMSEIGTMILTRRDAWLDRFKEHLPKEMLLRLRHADPNGDTLFGQPLLQEAMEIAQKKKVEKVQDKILYSQYDGKKGEGKKDFQKRDFRESDQGKNEGGSNKGSANTRGYRGGRGRGRGRGQSFERRQRGQKPT